MKQLRDLPEEIVLLKIATRLRLKDLLSFCSTCKRFRGMLHSSYLWHLRCHIWTLTFKQVVALSEMHLLRTVTHLCVDEERLDAETIPRVELPSLRSLDIDCFFDKKRKGRAFLLNIIPHKKLNSLSLALWGPQSLKFVFKKRVFPELTRLELCMHYSCTTSFMLKLIAQCPNVQELVIEEEGDLFDISCPSNGKISFLNLRSFVFNGCNTFRTWYVAGSPNLRVLDVMMDLALSEIIVEQCKLLNTQVLEELCLVNHKDRAVDVYDLLVKWQTTLRNLKVRRNSLGGVLDFAERFGSCAELRRVTVLGYVPEPIKEIICAKCTHLESFECVDDD